MWCGGSQVGWPSWNLTIYNIIPWFAGPMGQTTRPPSVWPSKYFFLIISYRLIAPKTLYNSCNFIKKKLKKIAKVFAKNFARIYEKINWNIRQLINKLFVPSPSEPAYYIANWRIFGYSVWLGYFFEVGVLKRRSWENFSDKYTERDFAPKRNTHL